MLRYFIITILEHTTEDKHENSQIRMNIIIKMSESLNLRVLQNSATSISISTKVLDKDFMIHSLNSLVENIVCY